MQPNGLGEANRFSSQSLNPSASGEMFTFNGLSIGFANGMPSRLKMA